MEINMHDPNLPPSEDSLIQILWDGGTLAKGQEQTTKNNSQLIAQQYFLFVLITPIILGQTPYS